MKAALIELIDFEKVNILLEGFNKTTGFVTAILDLDGNVLSKSGWRQMCTDFHRINPETSKKCAISDTELANNIADGKKYHFYKCLNGLVDVAVPIVINGEHIANLFSGQFFFEEPDHTFFKKQAEKYGFDEKKYMEALAKVPVVTKEKVEDAMDFLLNMTQLISESTFQRLEQTILNKALKQSEDRFQLLFNKAPLGYQSLDIDGHFIEVNQQWLDTLGYERDEVIGKWFGDFLTPMYQEGFRKRFPIFKAQGHIHSEFEMVHKNGSILFIAFDGRIGNDTDGNFMQTHCILQDITESKRVKEALLEAEWKFKALFEFGPIGVAYHRMIYDESGKPFDYYFIDANACYNELTGMSPKGMTVRQA
ncbi:MAG: PocR ligand-binding domain-containing protein, partial [Paludibacter sp.]